MANFQHTDETDTDPVLATKKPQGIPHQSLDTTLLYCCSPICYRNKKDGNVSDLHFSCYMNLMMLSRAGSITPFEPLTMKAVDLEILTHMGTPLKDAKLSNEILSHLKTSTTSIWCRMRI